MVYRGFILKSELAEHIYETHSFYYEEDEHFQCPLCYETFKSMDVQIRQDQICTFSGPQGTENICSGDSGSPLMVLKG